MLLDIDPQASLLCVVGHWPGAERPSQTRPPQLLDSDQVVFVGLDVFHTRPLFYRSGLLCVMCLLVELSGGGGGVRRII